MLTRTIPTHPYYDKTAEAYESPRPNARVRPGPAEDNYVKNQGSMKMWMDQSVNQSYESPRPAPRCPSAAAQEQYEKSKGIMGTIMSGHPSIPVERTIHPRGVRPGAQDIANSHKGGATKMLFTEYGNLEGSPRPNPRVKSEAADNAERNKGYCAQLFGSYGKLPRSARPEPRVPSRGAENAELDRGGRAAKILTMAPPSNRF